MHVSIRWWHRNEHQMNKARCLGGIDSNEAQAGSVLERGERLVEGESLRESLGALGTELVLPETAKERRWKMSKGIDSKAGGVRAHT